MGIDSYLVLAVSTLASIRMFVWLFSPSTHKNIAIGLYDNNKVVIKRIVYFGLFIIFSVFLIIRGNIINLMMALFAIGALYDFLFTFFEYPNIKEIDFKDISKLENISVKIPVLYKIRGFIAIPLITLTIWLWVSIL